MAKVRGIKVHEVDGLVIYVSQRPAKRTGRDRIWVSVRQSSPTKPWRVGATLAYSRAADIRFERANEATDSELD